MAAVTFNVPSAPARDVMTVDKFLGVDYTNSAGNVDETRSPNGQNMIRDVPGKVRKCMGYHSIKGTDGKPLNLGGRINGYHVLRGKEVCLIHAGTKIYAGEIDKTEEEDLSALYAEANDARSKSWQFDGKLYIIDGKALLVYDPDKNEIQPVNGKWADGTDIAYIPTLTITKAPGGGGTEYEALNLLQPKFKELFAGTAGTTAYSMTFGDLDDTPVTAKVMNTDGDWIDKTEGTDFSVNRTTGVVTFVTAPGVSPVTGEDNVEITAARTVGADEEKGTVAYAERVNGCNIGTLFGVNGASDRIFLSGNSALRNYDWYSGYNDPTYWPDTGYSVLGTDASAVVGYSIINNYLAAHKDEMEDSRNVIVRQGNLVENEPAFPICNTIQGPGAVAPWSFAYLSTEPVFLTRLGVYAITTSDISGERYAQNRSYFVNGKLLKEQGLEDAFSMTYKDMYWLCVNGVAYILDGLQPVTTDKGAPYSTRQYACFYRTNLPARVLWEKDGALWAGMEDGRIAAFYTDAEDPLSYNDDGAAITACWETPDFGGKLFYKNKTFRYLAVQLEAKAVTGVRVDGRRRGIWTTQLEDYAKGRFFSYGYMMYSEFTYSNDNTAKTLHTKIRLKKVDKAAFRFENDRLNMPFSLSQYSCEYVENGNYKL